ncbi:MAG: hypothetical protein ABJF10_05680 [Chthoniobacter sp.]|uniref:hypothetical protein n=1 Tax=Chthoniobacter sp. TaxID=2510640 RepID=UPI0032AA2AD1
MPTRILLLLLCSTVLTSCADQEAPPPGKKRKLEAITNPMGQTTYLYRDVDDR